MEQYLKQFTTHSAYDAVKNNLDKPNVVLCTQEDEIHYNPYIDPFNGHEYVDLNLPSGTLWATVCVGSENNTSGLGTTCNYQEAVEISSSWGGSWTLPTKEQYDELIQYTNVSNHTIENFSGGRIGMWDFNPKEDSTKHIGIVFSQYYPGGYEASCWTSTPDPENNNKHYAYAGGQGYSGNWYNYTHECTDSQKLQVLLVINP